MKITEDTIWMFLVIMFFLWAFFDGIFDGEPKNEK